MNKKKSPFRPYEKEYLGELVRGFLHIIENKTTNAVYNAKKERAWVEITKRFNDNPRCQSASHQQLKKLWINMKARAKAMRGTKPAVKQQLFTSGRSYQGDLSPDDDLLGNVSINIPNTDFWEDSDGDDNEGWGKNQETSNSTENRQTTLAERNIPLKEEKRRESTEYNIKIETLVEYDVPSPRKERRRSLNEYNVPPPRQNKRRSSSDYNIPSPSEKRQRDPIEYISCHLPNGTANSKAQEEYASTSSIPTIEALKLDLIRNDIQQRKQMFQHDLAHSARANEMRLNILKLEYDHKVKFYKLLEEEQAIKIRKAKEEF